MTAPRPETVEVPACPRCAGKGSYWMEERMSAQDRGHSWQTCDCLSARPTTAETGVEEAEADWIVRAHRQNDEINRSQAELLEIATLCDDTGKLEEEVRDCLDRHVFNGPEPPLLRRCYEAIISLRERIEADVKTRRAFLEQAETDRAARPTTAETGVEEIDPTQDELRFAEFILGTNLSWARTWEAAKRLRHYTNDKTSTLRAQLAEVSSAIGTSEFMDQPDGGDVSLGEQVRRMRAKLAEAEEWRAIHMRNNTILSEKLAEQDAIIKKRDQQLEAARRMRDELRDINVGVWKALGNPTYDQLAGRDIYTVIEDLRRDSATIADHAKRIAELEAALRPMVDGCEEGT